MKSWQWIVWSWIWMKSKYKVLICCDFFFSYIITFSIWAKDFTEMSTSRVASFTQASLLMGLAVILCLLCHFPQEASSSLFLRAAEHRIIPFQEVHCWLLSSLQGVWGVHSALHWPCTFPTRREDIALVTLVAHSAILTNSSSTVLY